MSFVVRVRVLMLLSNFKTFFLNAFRQVVNGGDLVIILCTTFWLVNSKLMLVLFPQNMILNLSNEYTVP